MAIYRYQEHGTKPVHDCVACEFYRDVTSLQAEVQRLLEEIAKLKDQLEFFEAEHYNSQIGGE